MQHAQTALGAPGDKSLPQLRLLRFSDAALEAEFVRYMHPKTITAIPVGLTLLMAFFTVTYAANPGIVDNGNFLYSAVVVMVSLVFIWPVHIMQRYTPSSSAPFLLTCERWILIFAVCGAAFVDIYFNFQHKSNGCEDIASSRVDQRRAFDDSQCTRWWSPFPVGLIAFMSAPQFIPFVDIAGASTFVFLCQCILWVPANPSDLLHQVYLQAVAVLAGLLFVCFVRYDHERTQRRQFMYYKRLAEEEFMLQEQQHELVEECKSMVPSAALQRLDAEDGMGSNPQSANVDSAEEGVVILLDFHDFARWCTTVRSMDVATAIANKSSGARVVAESCGVDFVANFGDMCVMVGNLCAPQEDAPRAALIAANKLIITLGDDGTLPPLRCSVHVGELKGVFSGSVSVRYDVFGPGFDTARAALMDAPPDCVFTSQDTVDAAGLEEAFDFSAGIVEIDGSAFGVLRSSVAVPSISSGLAITRPDVLDRLIPIAVALTNIAQANDEGSDSHGISRYHVPPNRALSQLNKRNTAEDALRQRLATLSDTRRVWCCFNEFSDAAVENEFTRDRMATLPRAAARAFAAFALYVVVLLALLIVDLPQPRDAASLALLLLAVGLATFLGLLPRLLGSETMARYYLAWSIAGTVMPLLVVFGTALARPAAVGVDPRLYMLVGTMLRTYLFTSTRWLLVVVPITFAVSQLHLILPGAHVRESLVTVAIFVFTMALAEIEREKEHRLHIRRVAQLQLVVEQLRKLSEARIRIMKSSLPTRVFELAMAAGTRDNLLVAWATPMGVVMLIRAPEPPAGLSSTSSSTSAADNQLDRRKVSPFGFLEQGLSCCKHLDIGELFGDSVIVVGPVVCSAQHAEESSHDSEEALREAVALGLMLSKTGSMVNRIPADNSIGKMFPLGDHSDGSTSQESELRRPTVSTGSDSIEAPKRRPSTSLSAAQNEFSALLDYDSVVHTTNIGKFASYHVLGVAATRLLAISAGTDRALLQGLLVTERVTSACRDDELNRVEQRAVGPFKVRGAGIIRLVRLKPEH